MGRCTCGKDTGWGGGKQCNDCYEKKVVHYGDKIKITGGFYYGQQGMIIGAYRDIGNDKEREFCRAYGNKTKLTNGEEVFINQFHMEKIENDKVNNNVEVETNQEPCIGGCGKYLLPRTKGEYAGKAICFVCSQKR